MKQIGFYLLMVILIFNCQSKEKTVEVEKTYPRNDRFIVSENDRRLDSIRFDAKKKGLEIDEFRYFNPEYSTGKIHFVIINEDKALFLEKSKDYYYDFLCGHNNDEDSIYELNQSFKYLDSLQFIKVNKIQEYFGSK